MIFLFGAFCTQAYSQDLQIIQIEKKGNKYHFQDKEFSYLELREEFKDYPNFHNAATRNIRMSRAGTVLGALSAGLLITGIYGFLGCDDLDCVAAGATFLGAIPFGIIGITLKSISSFKKRKSLKLLNGIVDIPDIGFQNTLELKLIPGSGLGLVYRF